MIIVFIKSVTLENYRCHKKSVCDFFPDGKAGEISIIEGGDGDGKTSIFNAIGWCLYGKETSELLGELNQSLGIPNVADIDSNTLGKVSVEVWLEFERDNDIGKRFDGARAVRIADVRGNRIVDHELTLELYRGSDPPEILKGSVAERFIDDIAPKDLIEFFMFNGEYLSRGGNSKGENIDASIKRQFRTGSIYSMEQLLGNVENDYRDSATKASKKQDSGIKSKITELEAYIEEMHQKKQKKDEDKEIYEGKVREAKERIELYRVQKGKIEGKREMLRELEGKKRESKTVSERLKEKYSKLHALQWNSGYLMLSANTIAEAYSKIKGEIGKANLPPNIKKEFIEDILSMHKCICGRELSEGSIEFDKIKSLKDASEIEASKNILLELSPILNSLKGSSKERNREAQEEYRTMIREMIEEQGRINSEIERIGNLANELTEEEAEVVKQFENAEEDLKRFDALANSCKMEAEQLGRDLESKRKDLETLKNKQIAMAEKVEEAKLFLDCSRKAAALKGIMKELRERISGMFISELQSEVNRLISSIKGLSHLSVSIRSVNGKIQVNYADKYLPLEGVSYLSEGQNQIISIALIAAYTSVLRNLGSGIAEVPFVVMDHPFSDLGLPRKEELLKSFNVLFSGTKVIMLTPHGDFDFGPLSKSIASHYVVKNDPQLKVCGLDGRSI